MAHRVFVDATAREWLVWDVIPQAAERRDVPDGDEPGRNTPGGLTALDRRSGSRIDSARRHLPAEMAEGWLCFESGSEKRRLAPIPPAWDQLTDGELERLMQHAQRATPREGQLDTTKLRALARPEGS